jgi:hypothetical protein
VRREIPAVARLQTSIGRCGTVEFKGGRVDKLSCIGALSCVLCGRPGIGADSIVDLIVRPSFGTTVLVDGWTRNDGAVFLSTRIVTGTRRRST